MDEAPERPFDSCGNCAFALTVPGNLQSVFCRRFPPQIVVAPMAGNMPALQVLFPTMRRDVGWCGEHKFRLNEASQ